MNIARHLLTLLVALLIGAFGASTTLGATSDSLYIGDATDNTIKRFDAHTGKYLGVFVPTSAGLHGPRGILHVGDSLLVCNQNVGLPIPGEIDRFSIANGRRWVRWSPVLTRTRRLHLAGSSSVQAQQAQATARCTSPISASQNWSGCPI